MASTAQCQAVSWTVSQSCSPTSCPNKIYPPRVVSWSGTAEMTSSALTRSECAVLVCFGGTVTEMSLKRLARTNWWNRLRISFARFCRWQPRDSLWLRRFWHIASAVPAAGFGSLRPPGTPQTYAPGRHPAPSIWVYISGHRGAMGRSHRTMLMRCPQLKGLRRRSSCLSISRAISITDAPYARGGQAFDPASGFRPFFHRMVGVRRAWPRTECAKQAGERIGGGSPAAASKAPDLGGERPLRQLPDFGRLAYPMVATSEDWCVQQETDLPGQKSGAL